MLSGAVDGGWSVWYNDTCTVTCGNGTITQTRDCDNPPPENGGDNCTGLYSREIECYPGPCPSRRNKYDVKLLRFDFFLS